MSAPTPEQLAKERDRLVERRADAVKTRRAFLDRAQALLERIKGFNPKIRRLRKRIAKAKAREGVEGIDQAGLEFIAGHEGEVLHGYNDSAGHCTIGIGHLLHLGNCSGAELSRTISHAQALDTLRQDASFVVAAIRDAVKVPLRQNEFNALCSLGFNIGVGGLRGSLVVARVNNGASAELIRDAFLMWVKATVNGQLVVVPGLVNRRKAEAALFNRKDTG